jgi:hypothetical protein
MLTALFAGIFITPILPKWNAEKLTAIQAIGWKVAPHWQKMTQGKSPLFAGWKKANSY